MVSETRYMQNATHTINGLTADKLATINTAVFSLHGRNNNWGDLTAYWGIRVWVRHVDESEDEITSGTPVAIVERATNGSGIQSNTWNCPETALVDTDAIVVKVYWKWGAGAWGFVEDFITEQVQDWDSPSQLDAETWTVWYHTLRTYDSKTGSCSQQYRHGDDLGASRIENFTWSEEAAEGGVLVQIM